MKVKYFRDVLAIVIFISLVLYSPAIVAPVLADEITPEQDSGYAGNTLLIVDQAQGTILNDDGPPPVVSFESASSGGSEAEVAGLSVVLSEASASTVTVDYTVTGGTATGGGVDYSLNSGTLSFAPGQTSRDIVPMIIADSVNDPDETIVVTLSNPVNAVLGVNYTHTYTIRRDGGYDTLNYESYTDEGYDAGYSSSHGATWIAQTFLTSVGHNISRVYVKAYRDINYTGKVNVSIRGTSGGLPSGSDLCSGKFNASAVTTSDNGEWIEVGLSPIVMLSGNTSYAIVLSPEADAGSYGSFHWLCTAYNRPSYLAGVRCTSVDSGSSWKLHTDEDLFFRVEGYYNDPPTVQITGYANGVEETDASAVLRIYLSGISSVAVSVDYAVSGGTATKGEDYILENGTLTFDPGQTSLDLSIEIVDDDLPETNETVEVSISNPVNAVLGATTSFTYIIRDDDNPATVSYEGHDPGESSYYSPGAGIARGEYGGQTFLTTVEHNVTGVYLKAYRGYDCQGVVAVSIRETSEGKPSGGDLCSGTFDSLSLTSGASGQWLYVGMSPVINLEDNRLYAVVVKNQGSEYHPGTLYWCMTPSGKPHYADGTYCESENGTDWSIGVGDAYFKVCGNSNAPPRVAFDRADSWGYENNTTRFPVSLSSVSSVKVKVDYSVGGTATGGGVDYSLDNGTLVFTPGQTNKDINITVVDDTLHEVDETVVVTLDNPRNATLGATTSCTYTITDNDSIPAVAVNDASVIENTGAMTFTLTLSNPSSLPVNVDFNTVDGTAKSPQDYSATSGTLTFDPGATTRTIDVTVVDDNLDENSETFIVSLTNPINATIADDQGQGTIIDNDEPYLSIDDSAVNEGNSGTTEFVFKVSLSTPALPGGVTFNIATGDGTADSPEDYTARTLTGQTIPAGSTEYSFRVAVNGDDFFETNETFEVNISNITGARVSDVQGQGTIINDDSLPDLAINLTSSPDRVFPGMDLIYSIVVTNNGTSDVAGFLVVDYLPENATFKSADTNNGFFEVNNLPNNLTFKPVDPTSGLFYGATGTWTLGGLAGGTSAYLNITVTVNSRVPAGSSLDNTASIMWEHTDPSTIVSSTTGTIPVMKYPWIPGLSLWGNGLLVLFFGITIAWIIRKRSIQSKFRQTQPDSTDKG